VLPRLDPTTCDGLRTALARADYTTRGVRGLLGPAAHAALARGEPEPAARASAYGGTLGVLVRMLLLGAVEPDPAVRAALAPVLPERLTGLLARDGAGWRAELDLRPYGGAGAASAVTTGADTDADDTDTDDAEWWVLSDLDSRRHQRDHVTGVGAATLTLASATVRTPANSLLDLGTGCGVQALHACRHVHTVTATDLAPRALALAAAGFALNGVEVELLDGPWLEPVAGRRFDRIVCNPPFVVGPGRVELVYRDSGQEGDTALARLVHALPEHLAPAGVAQLLGSWLHVEGEDWTERVGGWLPEGVDAWVIQREVIDPALHVGTWQRDSGLDPASPRGRAQAGTWLDWLADRGVAAVGFGLITLRRTDGAPTVVFEDLPDALVDPLGPEVAGWLNRVAWLRAHPGDDALLGARLTLAPSAVLERHAVAGDAGWCEHGAAVARRDGPRWRHEVDELSAALLAGCQGALSLGELLGLLAIAHDRPAGALAAAALPAVRELVRHGLLVPDGGQAR